jgi:hypothetical protein
MSSSAATSNLELAPYLIQSRGPVSPPEPLRVEHCRPSPLGVMLLNYFSPTGLQWNLH